MTIRTITKEDRERYAARRRLAALRAALADTDPRSTPPAAPAVAAVVLKEAA